MCNCNPISNRCRGAAFALRLLMTVAFFLAAETGFGQEPGAAKAKTGGDQRIHITADRLVVESNANTAEFIGNVNASQGTTVITSDRLKIYYKSDASQETGQIQTAALKKIVADGNVIIKMDDKVAVTDQAVYLTGSEVLILSGAGSKITSDNNSVSGDKITLHRSDNRMEIDGSTDKRVEAILYTKDKGIQ